MVDADAHVIEQLTINIHAIDPVPSGFTSMAATLISDRDMNLMRWKTMWIDVILKEIY